MSLEDFCIPGLQDYQIRQESRQSLRVDVEMAENADESAIIAELTRQMQAVIDAHGLGFVTFSCRRVDRILPDPLTGKKRLAIPLEANSANV